MILYYAHSIGYRAIMAESNLKEDMVETLWLCLRCSNNEELQITLENQNVTPNMFLVWTHGTFLSYLLQRTGPVLLHPTRSHGTLLCYTLQWAGPALLHPKGSHGTLLYVALAGAHWAGSALLRSTRTHGTLPGDTQLGGANNPQSAELTAFYYTMEEQSTATLQYFNPHIIFRVLPNEGLTLGILACANSSTAQASTAEPLHPHSLPPHASNVCYRTILLVYSIAHIADSW